MGSTILVYIYTVSQIVLSLRVCDVVCDVTCVPFVAGEEQHCEGDRLASGTGGDVHRALRYRQTARRQCHGADGARYLRQAHAVPLPIHLSYPLWLHE